MAKSIRKVNLEFEIDPVRWAWLEVLAKQQGQTVEEAVSDILHNRTLDFQQAYFADSDPDESPQEVAHRRNPGRS